MNSTKKRIFLDLDGVVTNFVMPAMKYWDAEISSEFYFPPDCGWNILKAVNIIRNEKGIVSVPSKVFWDSLDYNFWRTLPLYPSAREFVNLMQASGEVYFATSPTLSSACVAGKFDHISEDFPELRRRLIITADKSVLASENSILVDDRDKNCERFIEAGGKAVLVPRPWNDRGFDPYPLSLAAKEVLKCV